MLLEQYVLYCTVLYCSIGWLDSFMIICHLGLPPWPTALPALLLPIDAVLTAVLLARSRLSCSSSCEFRWPRSESSRLTSIVIIAVRAALRNFDDDAGDDAEGDDDAAAAAKAPPAPL